MSNVNVNVWAEADPSSDTQCPPPQLVCLPLPEPLRLPGPASSDHGQSFQQCLVLSFLFLTLKVVDKAGKVAADRVRVTWGKVDNFKCVDFFQIEYFEQHDPSGTVKMSGKINKNRKSIDLDIIPCSDYRFKVSPDLF